MNVLLKEILKQRPKSAKEFNANLKNVTDLMEFLHNKVDNIFKKWEAKSM